MSVAPGRRRVLVLGIGSPFGADRLGWRAVDALQASDLGARFPEFDLRFEQSDRPGSRLLALLGDADAAFIIDAMRSDAVAGSVARFDVAQLSPQAGLASSHGFGVAEALALGRQLGGLPDAIVVYGIEADPLLADDTLAAASLASLSALLQQDLEALRCD